MLCCHRSSWLPAAAYLSCMVANVSVGVIAATGLSGRRMSPGLDLVRLRVTDNTAMGAFDCSESLGCSQQA
jgi:hypothetical protein